MRLTTYTAAHKRKLNIFSTAKRQASVHIYSCLDIT